METEFVQAPEDSPLERIYIAAAVLRNFHGLENVEIQLFRSDARPEELEELKDKELVGPAEPEMPAELLAGATREAALACLLEAFRKEEIEELLAYLARRYGDHIERLTVCPIELPVPLGVGPLANIPEGKTSGFINFDLAPDYPLPFKFRGYYDLGGNQVQPEMTVCLR